MKNFKVGDIVVPILLEKIKYDNVGHHDNHVLEVGNPIEIEEVSE